MSGGARMKASRDEPQFREELEFVRRELDDANAVLAAIRQAGTTHGSRVREALENLKGKVDGVIMTYERPFTRSDHEAFDDPGQVTMGEVSGGRVVRAHEDTRKKTAK